MKTEIHLDAANWVRPAELYEALLPELQAPDWHGGNLNAAIDSLIYGGINKVEPPIRIVVKGLSRASDPVREEVEALGEALLRHRAYRLNADGADRVVEFEVEA